MTITDSPAFLDHPEGGRIAFHHHPGVGPGLVFLGGFRSDMTGAKALAIEAMARAEGRQMTRFDYRGHGRSDGDFASLSIGDWLEDCLLVLERIAQGPQIVIGSSMGGWLALLLARKRPERVAALILIAPAPDFTERLMWRGFSDETQREILETGGTPLPSAYSDDPTIITRRLIEDGRRHLLLDAPIPIACPVRILHGQADPEVPWRLSLDLAEMLLSRDVIISLIKAGDHRLSTPDDLALLGRTISGLSQVSASR